MKVTKEQIKQLRDIAAKLPKMYTAEGQLTISAISGTKLVDDNVFELSDGQPVSVNKTYIQKAEGGVEVNHFKRLLRIARTGEIDKIRLYINEVISINSQHTDLLRGMNQRMDSFKI